MPNETPGPVEAYTKRTKRSQNLHQRAEKVMPGGDTRSVTFIEPYPTYVDSAHGAELTTVDDEILIDFLNNYTQAIHGHAPEPVVDAVTSRFAAGNGLGSPTEDAIELAEQLAGRIPSVEHIRFANSGTEATMNAIRAAMAYTGREKVVKVVGGYHGTHDTVEVAISGEGREHQGIPRSIKERVISVPFNDTDALKRTFETHGNDIACFIVEPVMGAAGMIPAQTEYLETARDVTDSSEAVLIFDEVMSSRLSLGGAQKKYDVVPDLTALGKFIGGGLPIGAFGGDEEVMAVFDPVHGTASHSGTFNGNPATMAGGVATPELLDRPSIEQINEHGRDIRDAISEAAADNGVAVQVTGAGSLFHIHFTDSPVTDAASAGASLEGKDEDELGREFYYAMREEGIFMAPRGMGNISTVMGDAEVETFVDAANAAFSHVAEI